MSHDVKEDRLSNINFIFYNLSSFKSKVVNLKRYLQYLDHKIRNLV